MSLAYRQFNIIRNEFVELVQLERGQIWENRAGDEILIIHVDKRQSIVAYLNYPYVHYQVWTENKQETFGKRERDLVIYRED